MFPEGADAPEGWSARKAEAPALPASRLGALLPVHPPEQVGHQAGHRPVGGDRHLQSASGAVQVDADGPGGATQVGILSHHLTHRKR